MDRAFSAPYFANLEAAVPRLDLLLILVLAVVCAAVTASLTGRFEPLPLFGGVIIAGVYRSWRLSRQARSSQ